MALVDNTLVSVSADSTIRIWNPFSVDELDETAATALSILNENKSMLHRLLILNFLNFV